MKFDSYILVSYVDYPGRICTTFFTKGCNFNCPWCHNSELKGRKRNGKVNLKKAIAEINQYKNKISGITITGGEPTIWGDELISVLKVLKKETKLPIKLDTNGFEPEILETILKTKLISYVAMDIKATIENYYKATGLSKNMKGIIIGKIKKSIKIIKKYMKNYRFRTTVGHEFTKEEDIPTIEKQFGVTLYIQHYRDIEGE